MIRPYLRYLPGVSLVTLALVLYSRAGYGPFGDPARRGSPCTPTRCRHNATAVLVAALTLLGRAAFQHGQAPAANAAL